MSSLASSLGTCQFIPQIPKRHRKLCTLALVKITSQFQKETPLLQLHPNEKPNTRLLNRRETIGFLGFGFGISEGLLRLRSSEAAEAGPCGFTLAPSGLAFCDKVMGSGPEAVQGQLIKAHYVGKLENGKVFDSSYNRGKPLAFRIGVGEVIKGWDQGILGGDGIPPMLAGGKRILKLPPELGYGMRGAGCKGGYCIKDREAGASFIVPRNPKVSSSRTFGGRKEIWRISKNPQGVREKYHLEGEKISEMEKRDRYLGSKKIPKMMRIWVLIGNGRQKAS